MKHEHITANGDITQSIALCVTTECNPERSDSMLTMRMVAETPDGLCCIDVIMRGNDKALDAVAPKVRAFLDIGIEYGGAWVDGGTSRNEFTCNVS